MSLEDGWIAVYAAFRVAFGDTPSRIRTESTYNGVKVTIVGGGAFAEATVAWPEAMRAACGDVLDRYLVAEAARRARHAWDDYAAGQRRRLDRIHSTLIVR